MIQFRQFPRDLYPLHATVPHCKASFLFFLRFSSIENDQKSLEERKMSSLDKALDLTALKCVRDNFNVRLILETNFLTRRNSKAYF